MGRTWCGFKIPRFTEQLANDTLLDYGLKRRCRNFYHRDPILFITRDPRDVVCSMRALHVGESNWLQIYGIPIIQYWKQNSRQFAETFASELEYCEKAERQEIALAALYWKFKNSAYLRYLDLDYPVVRISYEALVRDPKTATKNAMSLLDLPWEDELFAHHEQRHTEIDADGKAIGNTDARRPISASSMNRYINELDVSNINIIREITSPLAEQLGYSLTE